MRPAKEYTDHLIINMFALDGPPRITHIWGFDSVQQRFDLRARLHAAGLWPPKGGPEQIEHWQIAAFHNTLVAPFSPTPR
jgi:NIPSNAP protein